MQEPDDALLSVPPPPIDSSLVLYLEHTFKYIIVKWYLCNDILP